MAGVAGSADGRRRLRCAGAMRYPEGGGLTAEERARRERVWPPAGGVDRGGGQRPGGGGPVSTEADVGEPVAAGAGRRRPPGAGVPGPGGARGQLSPAHLDELWALLDAGPVAWGGEDQCWTLPRIAGVVHERFGVDDPLAGLA